MLNFTTENYDNQVGLLKSFDGKLAYVMTLCLYKDDYGAFINVVEAIHDVTQFQVLSYNNVIVGKWNAELDCFEFDNNDDEEVWQNLVEKAQSNEASIDSESLDLLDDILVDKNKLKHLLFVDGSEICLAYDNDSCANIAGISYQEVIEHGLLPQSFKDKLYSLFKEYVLEIKQKNPVRLTERSAELEQIVYKLDVDFDNITFEQLTDDQHKCYMMVYKNRINNASVVLDYLLFEHIKMPELHEWTKLFNYHYS